jgi:hypothetical protein
MTRATRRARGRSWALSLISVVFLAACIGAGRRIDFYALYSRAATAEDLDRNPVILVPGMLGSTLKDSERTHRLPMSPCN